MTIAQVTELLPLDAQELLVVPASLDTLPLLQLLQACHDHLGRFRRGADNDPRFCLELFRRAIDTQDPDAWRGLVELCRPLLLARLQQRGIASDLAEEAVQEAFVTLWFKSTIGAVSTSDRALGQVLHYLWSGVRFALIKLRRQQHDVPLTPASECRRAYAAPGEENVVERALDAQMLLVRIRQLVTPQEWAILRLRFDQELPPRAIAVQLGIAVEAVYLILASTRRRLRNDPHLRAFIDRNNRS